MCCLSDLELAVRFLTTDLYLSEVLQFFVQSTTTRAPSCTPAGQVCPTALLQSDLWRKPLRFRLRLGKTALSILQTRLSTFAMLDVQGLSFLQQYSGKEIGMTCREKASSGIIFSSSILSWYCRTRRGPKNSSNEPENQLKPFWTTIFPVLHVDSCIDSTN